MVGIVNGILLYNFYCRNAKRELNDIRFEYIPGKDSADGIASELVGAGLVDGRDVASIASNLQKLIDQRKETRHVTFSLVRTVRNTD